MRTIKGKLIVTISAVAVMIMLTGSIGSYLIANSVVNIKVRELQFEKALEKAEEMNGWLAGQIAWVEENANAYEFFLQEFFQQKNYDEIKGYLEARLLSAGDTIMDAYYGFEDHTMLIINSEVGSDYDCCERVWYKQAKETGSVIVTDPYVDAFTGKIVVTIAVPLYNSSGEFAGVCGADITTEELVEVLDSLDGEEGGYGFIVDSAGYLVSCAGSDRLGESVFPEGADPGTKTKAYRNIAERTGFLGDKELSVYFVQDEKTGWEIIRATNQNELVQGLHQQQKILGVIIALSLLSVLPMTERLKKSVVKQKNAEIAALEAQINPHFLYNTLDTINWMAIDRDEYEISNMITTLARILRYGISDSNGVVKIRDEVEWLKQYIFLQQTRLKNAFDCHINVAPELMDLTVHKLLLQPFIENAILHGFEGVDRTCSLQMEMKRDHDFIEIKIEDNGCGIPDEIVREMNQGIFRKTEDKNHIGMENAITRLHMYYGERTRIMIHSKQGEGTLVQIRIPVAEAEEKSENSDR